MLSVLLFLPSLSCLEMTSHLIVRKIPAFGVYLFFSPYITSLVGKYSRVKPRERPGQNRNHLSRLNRASSLGSRSLGFVLLSLVHLRGKKKPNEMQYLQMRMSCHTVYAALSIPVYRSKRQEAFPGVVFRKVKKAQLNTGRFQRPARHTGSMRERTLVLPELSHEMPGVSRGPIPA